MTTPHELERAVKRSVDLMRYQIDRRMIPRAVRAWAMLWRIHNRRPDMVPDALSWERLRDPGPMPCMAWMAAQALDAQMLGGQEYYPVVSWIVVTRDPHIQERMVEIWSAFGDYEGDAVGDTHMVLLSLGY